MSVFWQIEEIQGLYGPFTISERVIQQIWRRGDFRRSSIETVAGKSLRVIDCGRWNQNEGPDFKEARIEIEGKQVVGDVEIHFHADDWFAHGHERDSIFDRVVLDVVLFQPRRLPSGYHLSGKPDPEVLVLLPLIDLDLEAYALENALLEREETEFPLWMERVLELPIKEQRRVLNANVHQRWSQKVAFAESRLRHLDWGEACHQMTLEVLGYARNREAMHRIAIQFSPGDFCKLGDVEKVFGSEAENWRLQGLRPANHPKKRLEQYRKICCANPKWAGVLLNILKRLPRRECLETAEFRRAIEMSAIRNRIGQDVFAGEIGVSRLNTLMCDAVLPLAFAGGILEAKSCWKHWYPGDAPRVVLKFLRFAQIVNSSSPMSIGLIQGTLQMFLNEGQAAIKDTQ